MTALILFDESNGIEYRLEPGETHIGRGADCTIRVLSSSVSRLHGSFDYDGQNLRYKDLGSSNGSFVNGTAVTSEVTLGDGDQLMLGDFVFKIFDEDAKHSEELDEDATQLVGDSATQINPAPPSGTAPKPQADIPAMWSEQAGLEKASGTEFFSEDSDDDAASKYRAGRIAAAPIGSWPRLLGLNSSIEGNIIELNPDNSPRDDKGRPLWKIGRDASAVDIAFDDSSISGMHAQIINDGNRWKIVNWMSTNGTFVNGQRALSNYLKQGDIISIGSLELAFELPANAPQAESPPTPNPPQKPGLWARLIALIKR
ncbi:FHA domain-containing protein [Spongiibacter nanhainus]|uniref:FHA domain-containing protein n=1 Tax=Spongiibacter nanhainus TaxID=2794344 RepID=A0A7T4R1R7_9GAMM|nr:FHA domain-containing protein [Spongiibacter nanhainus]QQD18664.1 FHA domain-containing protein [Spongiibacter nanhainus]